MLANTANAGNIKFMAVARATDKVIVASYVAKKNDFNEEQYYNAVNEVLAAPDFQGKVTPGSRYRLVGDVNAFNFTTDSQQRIYVVITVTSYPERLVFPLILNEMIPKFKAEFGDKSLTCAANALDKSCARLFQKLCEDYDDPGKKDKVAQVQQQVNDVKSTMHNNINSMLDNLGKTEKIEQDTKRLQDQASIFDRQARVLKHRERCKNYKLTAVLVIAVIIILIIIGVSLNNAVRGPDPNNTSG